MESRLTVAKLVNGENAVIFFSNVSFVRRGKLFISGLLEGMEGLEIGFVGGGSVKVSDPKEVDRLWNLISREKGDV